MLLVDIYICFWSSFNQSVSNQILLMSYCVGDFLYVCTYKNLKMSQRTLATSSRRAGQIAVENLAGAVSELYDVIAEHPVGGGLFHVRSKPFPSSTSTPPIFWSSWVRIGGIDPLLL